MRRIGVLTAFAENDPESQRRIAALRRGLRELGWTEDSDLRIDFQWAAGDSERIRTYATELVASKPDVILVNSAQVLQQVQRESLTIPIVFVQIGDPVGSGLVTSSRSSGRKRHRIHSG